MVRGDKNVEHNPQVVALRMIDDSNLFGATVGVYIRIVIIFHDCHEYISGTEYDAVPSVLSEGNKSMATGYGHTSTTTKNCRKINRCYS